MGRIYYIDIILGWRNTLYRPHYRPKRAHLWAVWSPGFQFQLTIIKYLIDDGIIENTVGLEV